MWGGCEACVVDVFGGDVFAGGEGASDLVRGRWCVALARRPLPDPSSSYVASPRSRSPPTGFCSGSGDGGGDADCVPRGRCSSSTSAVSSTRLPFVAIALVRQKAVAERKRSSPRTQADHRWWGPQSRPSPSSHRAPLHMGSSSRVLTSRTSLLRTRRRWDSRPVTSHSPAQETAGSTCARGGAG